MSVLARRFGDHDLHALPIGLAVALARGALLMLAICGAAGFCLHKAGFAVSRRRPAPLGQDAGIQTASMPTPVRQELGNAEQICWLEPCSSRNRWHLDPECRGFDGRRGRITGHLACRICAHGLVKTTRTERGTR